MGRPQVWLHHRATIPFDLIAGNELLDSAVVFVTEGSGKACLGFRFHLRHGSFACTLSSTGVVQGLRRGFQRIGAVGIGGGEVS